MLNIKRPWIGTSRRMSRKRDTNWSKDEIKVLLDSMMEITRKRAQDGKRINSREIFEYAAKKLGEKGHSSRAEREKCRAKWKKMKEEYTHAKKAREGDSRYKEAPGILPFFDMVEMFINSNYDNISPHSTLVRRTYSISNPSSPDMRPCALIAVNANGTTPTTTTTSNSSIDNDSSSTNLNADISYRVTSGFRQITIFGDHDVDIKFRGDCVTINKIDQ